ncbi:M23 family metallopeptidase [Paraferrimonas sedimenticola]|uniref:Periplasmic metalloprotease M23B family protein n=1 Tax=Paraferrimonas sedimenticola TaxID=375674 RepID=A0AA37RZ05_9GAMM|nr:M23 family metallopeptidase [Paraferrimonas sedimenticola]GLP97985.1 periplasmic metalloprotease M23B family protein [Paraferrimonas sedimenticola]
MKKTITMFGLLAWAVATSSLAATQLKGEMTQGSLIRGETTPGAEVTLNDKSLLVSKQGFFVFGFDRDSKAKHLLKVEHPDGEIETLTLDVQPREYKKQMIEGIAKNIMQPSQKELERAAQDTRQIHEARSNFIDNLDYLADFQWPLLGRITGVYGSQRVYNGVPGRPHFGIDIAKPEGTPIVAPASGIITVASPDMFYSGGTIVLDHGYGVTSTFLHMSKLSVREGQRVQAGEKIGEVGSTGRSTGPHLDWRVNWYQLRLDPQYLVPSMKEARAAAKQ